MDTNDTEITQTNKRSNIVEALKNNLNLLCVKIAIIELNFDETTKPCNFCITENGADGVLARNASWLSVIL